MKHILPYMLLAVLLLPPVAGWAADLFTPVDDTPSSSASIAAITLRSRAVTIDLAQLQRAQAAVHLPAASESSPQHVQSRRSESSPQHVQSRRTVHGQAASLYAAGDRAIPEPGVTLSFNLFDDVVVTGLVEQTAPTFSGGYSLAGHIVDEPLETFTLVVNGETVAGTVRTLGGTYRIRSVGDGLYAINEVDLSQLPERCGVVEPAAEGDALEHPFH